MPKGKKEEEIEMTRDKRRVNPTIGPGSVDGTGSDSPIIITDGSCQMISINDDFHPTALRSSGAYVISKSNGGTLTIKPDNVTANAANGVAAATCTITLLDNAANTIIIKATPALSATSDYYNWTISVTTSLTTFGRFDMNGGESRIAHSSFKILSGTVMVGTMAAQNLQSPKHLTIHFR